MKERSFGRRVTGLPMLGQGSRTERIRSSPPRSTEYQIHIQEEERGQKPNEEFCS